MNLNFWKNRSVLITGHTGFKGGWLALLLHKLGAKVHGYSLDPPTQPNLFEVANIATFLASDTRADLSDFSELQSTIHKTQPDIIFHLAAQSLVRESYRDPLNTLKTNVIGTAYLLEALRAINGTSVKAIVMITTDKIYENREWLYPYRETDPLGGHDLYSASKAAAEIIIASYRKSFFNEHSSQLIRIATVRAGNVIGGGDWAIDRLVPDCIRAVQRNKPLCLRFPDAVRPWQHVLEPLAGYLKVSEKLLSEEGDLFTHAWNFGPDVNGHLTVKEIVKTISELWGKNISIEVDASNKSPHEAGLLSLDSHYARHKLGWKPRWSLEDALKKTVWWYEAWMKGDNMLDVCLDQISEYE